MRHGSSADAEYRFYQFGWRGRCTSSTFPLWPRIKPLLVLSGASLARANSHCTHQFVRDAQSFGAAPPSSLPAALASDEGVAEQFTARAIQHSFLHCARCATPAVSSGNGQPISRYAMYSQELSRSFIQATAYRAEIKKKHWRGLAGPGYAR